MCACTDVFTFFMRSMLHKVCSTNSFFLVGGFESPIHEVFSTSSFFYLHEDFIYKVQLIYEVQLLISTFFTLQFFKHFF